MSTEATATAEICATPKGAKVVIYSRTIRQIKVTTVMEQPATDAKTDAPEVAAQFWRDTIAQTPWFDSMKEQLVVLLLNTRYHITGFSMVSVGSANESLAHPREVFRPAIVAASYAMIVMHNHPSGDPSPSQSDHSLTRRLAEGAELLQIKLLDHIVVGEPRESQAGYFSFKEAGVL
jgi:DNA repair protein RadC